MTHFDVVVLGAGPGGYVAAIRAAQSGLKTAIVEKQWFGGVCLNVGCVPTKALLRNAEIARILGRQADLFGIRGQASVDYGAAFARSREVSGRMVKGVHFLLRKNKVTEYVGWGSFSDAHSLAITGEDGVAETLTFDHCIIATGATPSSLPNVAIGGRVVTYEQMVLSDAAPQSLVICGAGAIGMEFAFIMNSFGTQVTVVEYQDRVLPLEDPESSAELAKACRAAGIDVRTSTMVKGVTQDDQGATVYVQPASGGDEVTVRAEKVLVAIGFTPRTAGYGLERTGVGLTERGAITIDERMRTNVPSVYAIGDVTGKLMLAHVASRQGIIAADTIAGKASFDLNYAMMPRATYTAPQVASFGYTAEQATALGHDVKVSKFPLAANAKAWGLGEGTGFVKIIADTAHDEILGAYMVGPDVTELLPELTLAQLWDLTADEIALNVHAHPTLSEAIMEAAEGVSGPMINY